MNPRHVGNGGQGGHGGVKSITRLGCVGKGQALAALVAAQVCTLLREKGGAGEREGEREGGRGRGG